MLRLTRSIAGNAIKFHGVNRVGVLSSSAGIAIAVTMQDRLLSSSANKMMISINEKREKKRTLDMQPVNLFGYGNINLHRDYQHILIQNRSIIHFAPLAVAFAKLATVLAVKKVFFISIINQIGVERSFSIFRKVNDTLLGTPGYKCDENIDTQDIHAAMSHGITALEKAVNMVNKESEKLDIVWSWFEEISKKYPDFVDGVAKNWLNYLTPASISKILASYTRDASKENENVFIEDPDIPKVEKLIREKVKEAKDYHIILVPKDPPSPGKKP